MTSLDFWLVALLDEQQTITLLILSQYIINNNHYLRFYTPYIHTPKWTRLLTTWLLTNDFMTYSLCFSCGMKIIM